MAVDSIHGAASQIAGAIRDAARSTGASFEYLLTTARIESNLNPVAQAATSTAKGLYQFIDQTWLATMKQAGPALGLTQYANAIVQMPDGSYAVPDAAARAAIMKLRSDPEVSAKMAGVFTRSNEAKLAASIGRPPSEAELYIAHFLGPEGAAKLITAAASQPQSNAAAMFPAAAAANRMIFYNNDGQPLGASTVYQKLTGRYDVARALVFSPHEANGAGTSKSPVPDTAGVTQAYADAQSPLALPPPSNRPSQGPQPLFQALFSDVPRHGVSPAVTRLWNPSQAGPQPAAEQSGLYNLFKDPQPASRRPTGGKV